jgi:hypothetical protein
MVLSPCFRPLLLQASSGNQIRVEFLSLDVEDHYNDFLGIAPGTLGTDDWYELKYCNGTDTTEPVVIQDTEATLYFQ